MGRCERWMNSLLSCHGQKPCLFPRRSPNSPSRSTPTPMNHHDMVLLWLLFLGFVLAAKLAT